MAQLEDLDGILFVLTDKAEQAVVEKAMAAIGAERDDVGGGIVLFLLDNGVFLRTREAQTN
jgi:hypothetical protein